MSQFSESIAALSGRAIPAEAIALPTAGGIVQSVEAMPAPSDCYRVRGVIHPSDPAAPDIRFEAGFPARWNRKALHSGGGGLDGVVIPVEMPRPGGLQLGAERRGTGELRPRAAEKDP